jgi:hypothetical protein
VLFYGEPALVDQMLQRALKCLVGVSPVLAACTTTADIPPGNMRAADCMVSILKMMPGVADVRIGTTFAQREGYLPTVRYSFANSAGRHQIEIRVGGNEDVGYGYLQRSVRPYDGNPVTSVNLSGDRICVPE